MLFLIERASNSHLTVLDGLYSTRVSKENNRQERPDPEHSPGAGQSIKLELLLLDPALMLSGRTIEASLPWFATLFGA